MGGPLVLAVPSKGRLQENADAFFARAGLELARERGARDYRGFIRGVEGVEVWFLSAGEIARELSLGNVHLGVTGEDLVREGVPDADTSLEMVAPLGFGRADVVVAVPQLWIDVRTMADLDDVAQGFRARHGRRLRVATKYVNLTRAYFASHAVGDYVIVESLGATEGTPASGAADLIVDITTTGATLAANGLKVLDDGIILASQANLVAALRAPWDDGSLRLLRILLDRIAAEERARTIREVRALVIGRKGDLAARAIAQFDCEAPEEDGSDAGAVVLHCPVHLLYPLIDFLREQGAHTVTVTQPGYVFSSTNALFTGVVRRLR